MAVCEKHEGYYPSSHCPGCQNDAEERVAELEARLPALRTYSQQLRGDQPTPYEQAQQRIAELEAKLAELERLLRDSLQVGHRDPRIERQIADLCRATGFGAVLSETHRQYVAKYGDSAFTVGHCHGTVRKALGEGV